MSKISLCCNDNDTMSHNRGRVYVLIFDYFFFFWPDAFTCHVHMYCSLLKFFAGYSYSIYSLSEHTTYR